MKILNEKLLITPIHVVSGECLRVTWLKAGKERIRMDTIIETEQIIDRVILVEYTPEEANALGFKSALGVISGEKL